jgi:hypothetical protein
MAEVNYRGISTVKGIICEHTIDLDREDWLISSRVWPVDLIALARISVNE